MKKIIIALATALSMSVIAAPAVSASTQTVVVTKASDYSTKKKNSYWNGVRRLNSDARIIGKRDVIDMGVSICDLLRAGADMDDLAQLVYEADPIIEDLLIASMAAAPVYLCPDQQYKFD